MKFISRSVCRPERGREGMAKWLADHGQSWMNTSIKLIYSKFEELSIEFDALELSKSAEGSVDAESPLSE